jgi:hypothetical protein
MGKYKNNSNRICKRNNSIQEKSPKNELWDEECRQAIKQKNIARIKCLQQKTRANQEHYKGKRM